jgi:hypothetical protein
MWQLSGLHNLHSNIDFQVHNMFLFDNVWITFRTVRPFSIFYLQKYGESHHNKIARQNRIYVSKYQTAMFVVDGYVVDRGVSWNE